MSLRYMNNWLPIEYSWVQSYKNKIEVKQWKRSPKIQPIIASSTLSKYKNFLWIQWMNDRWMDGSEIRRYKIKNERNGCDKKIVPSFFSFLHKIYFIFPQKRNFNPNNLQTKKGFNKIFREKKIIKMEKMDFPVERGENITHSPKTLLREYKQLREKSSDSFIHLSSKIWTKKSSSTSSSS